MTEDESEVHSVLVELEASSPTADDLARVDGSGVGPSVNSAGISRWVIAAGFAVVGLLVVLFISLRPSNDTALDGTDRGTTTTTNLVEPEVFEEASIELSNDVAEEVDAEFGISPTVIGTEGSIESIVSYGAGYIAASDVDEGTSPTILRSLDGVDWFEVETSASTGGEPVTENFAWFNLLRSDQSLAVTAFNGSGLVSDRNEVFVSDDGANWVALETAGDLDSDAYAFFLYGVNDDSLIGGRNTELARLYKLVEAVSTLEIPEAGVCDLLVRTGLASVANYEVTDCRGQTVGTIDDSNLREGVSPEDLYSCVGSVRSGSFRYIHDEELVRLELGQDGELTVLGTITFIDSPVNTSNGGVVLIDGGVPTEVELDACREFIELPEPADPSIVVIDPLSNQLDRLPLPTEWSSNDSSVPFRAVGEVRVTGRSQLVVQAEGALWAIDLETGVSDGPLTSPELGEINRLNRIGLSESGNRAYAVVEGEFVTLDFGVATDGSLEVLETVESLANDQVVGDFVDILYANDDIVFFSNFTSTWVVNAPPLPTD